MSISTLLFLLITVIQFGRSVQVSINKTSLYDFQQNILKASVTNFQGQEFVFILFDNGTISKLDAQLEFIDLIEQKSGKKIIDFEIYNNPNQTNQTPSILTILEAKDSMKIITIANTSLQIQIPTMNGTVKVIARFCSIINQNTYEFYGGYYAEDILDIIKYINGNKMPSSKYNHTSGINGGSQAQNIINRVIQPAFQPSLPYFSLTYSVLGKTYLFSYKFESQIPFFYNNITSQKIENQNVTDWFSDRDQLHILQTNSGYALARNITPSLIWLNFKDAQNNSFDKLYTTDQKLKAIRPRLNVDGDRFFVFNNKIVKYNLNNNLYVRKQTTQSDLPFLKEDKLGFVVFSSGLNGFVYTRNSSTIYSYCQSKDASISCTNHHLPCPMSINYCQTCTNRTNCQTCQLGYYQSNNICLRNCSFVFPFCQTCDSTFQSCQQCQNNYFLINNTCFQIIQCINASCLTCIQNNLCVVCQAQFLLNLTDYTCYSNKTTQQNNLQFQNKIEEEIKQFNQTSIQKILNDYGYQMQIFANSVAIMNSSPLYRLFLGFLAPMFGLLDDYWYYIYHHNNFKNLEIFPKILVFLYFVNSQRILPDYLSMPYVLTIKPFAQSQYYEKYTSERILLIDQKMTHLEQNLEPLIFQQYLYEMVFFILVACLVKIMKKCYKKKPKSVQKQNSVSLIQNQKSSVKSQEIMSSSFHSAKHSNQSQIVLKVKSQQQSLDHKNQILKSFIDYFQDSISFKSIILTLIGANLIFLSFEISLQFGVFFSFKFIDTVNLLFTLICGMLFIIAFCTLLALCEVIVPTVKISKKDSKKEREEKLEEKEDIQNEDFYELVFECIKCVLYGFIHGYFINHNQVQYVLLIMVKIFLISVILKRQKYFKHQVFSVLKILYFLMGIGVDLLCLISKMRLIPQSLTSNILGPLSTISMIELVMISIMFLTVLLYVIIDLFFGIKQNFCSNNRVRKTYNLNFFNFLKRILPLNQYKNDNSLEDSETGRIYKRKINGKKPLQASYKNKINLKKHYNKKMFQEKTQVFKKDAKDSYQNARIDLSKEKKCKFDKKYIFEKKLQQQNLRTRKQKKVNFVVEYVQSPNNQVRKGRKLNKVVYSKFHRDSQRQKTNSLQQTKGERKQSLLTAKNDSLIKRRMLKRQGAFQKDNNIKIETIGFNENEQSVQSD